MESGYQVIGLDNINDYYDVNLKNARINDLKCHFTAEQFTFIKADLCKTELLKSIFERYNFYAVINLAAQAGVRYSLQNPQAYVNSNLVGFVNILENCRHSKISNLIYASSSSVYGNNQKLPFDEDDPVNHPISLYAATKKSNELLAHSYSHLFSLPTTGLRFFTVYGPWGRPDMAMYLFAEAILKGEPIRLFNNGNMLRDFTYVDDVAESIVRLCEKPANSNKIWDPMHPKPSTSSAPYNIFNIGNNSPVLLLDVVDKMEKILQKKAIVKNEVMQPGDVPATFADVKKLFDSVQFNPKTSLDEGLNKFLNWYLSYTKQS